MRIALAAVAKGYDVLVYCVEWLAELPVEFQVIVVEVSGVANHTRYASFAKFVLEDVSWRVPAAVIGFNRMPGLDLYYAADSCFEHKARNMRTALYRRTDRYKVMSEFERAVFGEQAKTHIMLISRNQAEQYQRYYHTPPSRLSFLPPGVSRDRMRSDDWQIQRRRVREEFAVADDEFLLLLVGSGFITKGLDRVLNMLGGLPQKLRSKTKLLVIGQDNPRQFIRQAKNLGVDTQLTILKGRDDIPALLQGADLMVHPAYMESGGMVLIEAIIAGLPVIASGACGFAHYIDDAQAGVVLDEPFAQAEFDRYVVAALSEPLQRKQWSNNGVEFGRAHDELYDMPAHALRVIDEYIARHKPKHSALTEPAA